MEGTSKNIDSFFYNNFSALRDNLVFNFLNFYTKEYKKIRLPFCEFRV